MFARLIAVALVASSFLSAAVAEPIPVPTPAPTPAPVLVERQDLGSLINSIGETHCSVSRVSDTDPRISTSERWDRYLEQCHGRCWECCYLRDKCVLGIGVHVLDVVSLETDPPLQVLAARVILSSLPLVDPCMSSRLVEPAMHSLRLRRLVVKPTPS